MPGDLTNPPPIVFAHRGVSAHYPENSLEAFAASLELGVQAVELDVHLSADGVPVVIHDPTLLRTHGHMGRVAHSASYLFKRLGVPLLEDVVSLCAGHCTLLVELKGSNPNLVPAVLEELEGCQHKLLSFKLPLLEYANQLNATVDLVLNLKKPLQEVELLNSFVMAYSCDMRSVTDDFISRIKQAQKEIWVFTCNTLEQYQTMSALGVDAVFSDDPARLLKA